MAEKTITKQTRQLLEEYKRQGKLIYWKWSDRYTSGVPDFHFMAWSGKSYYLELKDIDKDPSRIQDYTHKQINDTCSGHLLVTDQFSEVRAFLEDAISE